MVHFESNRPAGARRLCACVGNLCTLHTCRGFRWELLGLVSRASLLRELVDGVIHMLCGGKEDVEGYTGVKAEFRECMPVGKLEEEVCNGLVVLEVKETFERRHDCLYEETLDL